MFNIILVDDENFSIDTLTEIIDFNMFGFNIAGTFYDVKSALEFIDKNSVDAIVTDIKMPGMSGLDFLSVIKNTKPEIEVIFLTAYADFDYAQFAIDYKLFKYMLKPVTIADMSKTLSQLNDYLISKNKPHLSSEVSSFREPLNPSVQKMLYDYLHKPASVSFDTLLESFSASNADFDPTADLCTIINIDFTDLDGYFSKASNFNQTTLFQSIKNMMFRNDMLVCPFLADFSHVTAFIAAKTGSFAGFNKLVHSFINSLISNSAELLDIQLVVSSSRIFNDIKQLAQYNHAAILAKHDASLLLNQIQNVNTPRTYIPNKLKSLFSENESVVYYKENLTMAVHSLILTLMSIDEIKSFNLYPKSIDIPLKNDEQNMPKQLDELIKHLPNTLENLTEYFSNDTNANSSIIHDAIAYVQAHYTDKISLDDTAKFVHCNPTYLSRKIKDETGHPFTDYLNLLRLKHAENLLLNTKLTVNEVAVQSGYYSLSYFYRKFKEKNNCSPDTYKNNIKSQE